MGFAEHLCDRRSVGQDMCSVSALAFAFVRVETSGHHGQWAIDLNGLGLPLRVSAPARRTFKRVASFAGRRRSVL